MYKVKLEVFSYDPSKPDVQEIVFSLPFIPQTNIELQIEEYYVSLHETPSWIGDKDGDGYFYGKGSYVRLKEPKPLYPDLKNKL